MRPPSTAIRALCRASGHRSTRPGAWRTARCGGAKAQRVEVRIGAADANPYLALAAALASGLYGIEQQLRAESPVTGNAYAQEFPDSLKLPNTLWDAAQRLKQSEAARALFGDSFVDHFAATREWEERMFRRHVTDWELARYFEII
jgi:glutamine synthetase